MMCHNSIEFIILKNVSLFFFDVGGFRTSDLHFMRRGPQPIELLLGDPKNVSLSHVIITHHLETNLK
jgi:hypothetical protein